MTDQISFLPMLDDAEHPTWLLSGKELLKLCKKACDRIAKEVP